MPEKNKFYDARNYGDRLEPGDRLTIEHYLYYESNGDKLSTLTHMTADQLQALRDSSAASEKVIYEKLRGATKEWEEQAANTMLLDKAIEYVKTPPIKHTANEWVADEYGFECSNLVYKMTYQICEDEQFNPRTRKHDTPSWLVSWDISYNFPPHARGGGHIAGQDRKRFTSKEKMDNYLIGRMAVHSEYFTTLSPPVPKNLAWKFSRNGQLLPGYTVEGQKPVVPETASPAKEQAATGTDYSKFIRKKAPKDFTTGFQRILVRDNQNLSSTVFLLRFFGRRCGKEARAGATERPKDDCCVAGGNRLFLSAGCERSSHGQRQGKHCIYQLQVGGW